MSVETFQPVHLDLTDSTNGGTSLEGKAVSARHGLTEDAGRPNLRLSGHPNVLPKRSLFESKLSSPEQRSIVHKTSDRLIVEKDDQILLEIPCLCSTTAAPPSLWTSLKNSAPPWWTASAPPCSTPGILRLDDFMRNAEGGVQLHREALKRYFAAYEKEVTTPFSVQDEDLSFRQLFRRQAERLARTLIEGDLYEPFQLPC